jgi:hypothetical protein
MMGGMRGMADIPDLAGQHAGYVVEHSISLRAVSAQARSWVASPRR